MTNLDPETINGGLFDVLGCIENTVLGMPIVKGKQITLKGVFVSLHGSFLEKNRNAVNKSNFIESYRLESYERSSN